MAQSFNPNQPRANDGKWTDTGAGGINSSLLGALREQISQGNISLDQVVSGTATKPALKQPVSGHSAVQAIPRKEADRYSQEQVRKLSPDELSDLKTYTSNEQYQTINAGLRTNGKLPKEMQDTVGKLDKALTKHGLPKDTTLYRARRTMPSEWKVGAVISDKAYVSTSTELKQAEEFAGADRSGPIMRIRAAKGTKGLFTSAASDWPEESEFLLPRGQKFKITNIVKSDNRTYIDMELAS